MKNRQRAFGLSMITSALSLAFAADMRVTDHGAKPNDAGFDTKAIQSAIDACATSGGGIVRLSGGSGGTARLCPVLARRNGSPAR